MGSLVIKGIIKSEVIAVVDSAVMYPAAVKESAAIIVVGMVTSRASITLVLPG